MKWHYQRTTRRLSWLQLLLAVAGCLVVGGSVSFAALSQQAKLTGNSIQTATANLQISADGNTYGNTLSGFNFSSLVPGGRPMPLTGYQVYLKNSGTTPIALKLAVTSKPTNPDNVDLAKVHVVLTPTFGGSIQNVTLAALIAAADTGGEPILLPAQLMPTTAFQYTVQIQMEADALNGSSATIGGVDFSFTGLAQSN